MTTQTEALKEAHDLSLDGRDFAARQIILDVIANLEKEALAQPDQEPVAWIYRSTGALFDICPNDANEGEFVPLYTTPPQRTWVGLTDEEHMILYTEADGGLRDWARAIEAKLKDKNTRGQE